ncbi:hypothetical protein GALMADRAFT_256082 [Galerina marginata CBS 339.88]|uniref:Uncharacterized protein n=1 Tax=Galerina marginata (strain CBS 339.88) TaxID=685588 RepID=A0A067SR19_GALM3|nr:hypothetical protein GALMADRAFT_256082 [Galerina marginata CBS 339.88]
MKSYQFDLIHTGNIELIQPVSDGQSFIFTFPTIAFQKTKSLGIRLYFDNTCTYTAILYPSKAVSICGVYLVASMPVVQGDANIVVRVDKTFHATASWTTYINGQHIRCSACQDTNNGENRVAAAGVAIDATDALAASLTAFPYAAYGEVEAWAEAMRNPEPTDIDIVVGNDGRVSDQTKDPGEKEVASATMREVSVHTDSTGGANPSPASEAGVCPPDADLMKLSSTMAWPKAMSHFLGTTTQADLQKRHDTVMGEWVVARGDNISSKAYDYFVYSHGVVWPRTILEFTADADFLKIRSRHIGILKVLEDGLEALKM